MQTIPINGAMLTTAPQTAGPVEGIVGGDGIGFNSMLMQLLGGSPGELEGEAFGQNAQELLAQLQGKDQKDVTSQEAMELMNAMFFGASNLLSIDLNPSPMAYHSGSQSEAAVGVAETLQTIGNAAQTMQLNQDSLQAAMTAVLAQSGTEMTPAGAAAQTQTPAQAFDAAVQEMLTVEENLQLQKQTATSLALSPELLQAQKSEPLLLDPLQSAQLRLRQLESSKGQTPDDALAQLQAAANPKAAETTVPLPGTAERVAHQAILQQVETGIRQHLKEGDSEFTIKLRPQGLGEITVKLVEQQGKMSLSIVTATQQAQNALSSQIGALREALQPYEVQVTQVVSQQTLDFEQSMTQQQQRQQQQQQHQTQWAYQEESESPQLQQQYAQALHTALNTYI